MIYFIRAGDTGAVKIGWTNALKAVAVAILLGGLARQAYGQRMAPNVAATDAWRSWVLVGYDLSTDRQAGFIAPFVSLTECIEAVNKQKHVWSKYILYCLPGETEPLAGAGIQPKR